jgi:hypothetical protein
MVHAKDEVGREPSSAWRIILATVVLHVFADAVNSVSRVVATIAQGLAVEGVTRLRGEKGGHQIVQVFGNRTAVGEPVPLYGDGSFG